MGGKLQLQRFCPRSERTEPHIGLPNPGVLPWEDEPLKGSKAYFQESQRAMGNRESTL